MPKNKPHRPVLVYSTDPGFLGYPTPEEPEITLAPAEQRLQIKLETKHRAGKAVTIVGGFIGTNDAKESIGKKLKACCGTGGAVKGGLIIIQGDHREKLFQWLLKNGFVNSKKI